jgi:serine/threonine-protein kinase
MSNSWTGKLLCNRYRVGRPLGNGPVGEAYAATRGDERSDVVLKIFRPSAIAAPGAFARFEAQARAASRIGHPCILPMLEVVPETGGEPAVAEMEPAAGPSLERLIEESGRLPEGRAASIAAHILSVLGAAHRAGVIHRDLKPRNIFVPANAAIRVSDFATAELLERLRRSRLASVSLRHDQPAYLAPEQARDSEVDARADVYAVGALLYFALCGRPPFEAAKPSALLYAVLTIPPPPLAKIRPDVSPALAAIVSRSLAKEPAVRFANAEEMRAALEPWERREARAAAPDLAEDGPDAPSAPTPEPPARFAPPTSPSQAADRENEGSELPAGSPAQAAAAPLRFRRAWLLAAAAAAAATGILAYVLSSGDSLPGSPPGALAAPAPAAPAPAPVAASTPAPGEPSPTPAPATPRAKAEEVVVPPRRTQRPRSLLRRPARQAVLSVMTTNGVYPPSMVHDRVRLLARRINGCFAASRRKTAGWRIRFGGEGDVEAVRALGKARRDRRLQRCMRRLFRRLPWGRPSRPSGGAIELHFKTRPRRIASR